MRYRYPGVFFHVPRSKKELIQMIVDGGWKGTKQALKDMEHKQLKAILISQRNKAFTDMMSIDKKNIPQTHTQTNEAQNE